MAKKKIPFKGFYWWGDSENVTSILKEELGKILSETQIHRIEIHGNDFNDGKQNRRIDVKIDVSDGNITITKSY